MAEAIGEVILGNEWIVLVEIRLLGSNVREQVSMSMLKEMAKTESNQGGWWILYTSTPCAIRHRLELLRGKNFGGSVKGVVWYLSEGSSGRGVR